MAALRLKPMAPGQHMRPLGSLERVYDLWRRKNALSFSVIARLNQAMDSNDLRRALDAVQSRHPLLAATVVDPSSNIESQAPMFVRTNDPIDIQVRSGVNWPEVVGQELAAPFARDTQPLLKVSLVDAEVLVLTFEHTVAGGLPAVAIIKEVVAVLNNAELVGTYPIPRTQEDLVQSLPATGRTALDQKHASLAVDPRMVIPCAIEPSQNGTPIVRCIAWTQKETNQLISRCRAERTTVTGALAAAAAHITAAKGRHEYLRLSVPYDVDRLIFEDEPEGLNVNIGKISLGWAVTQLSAHKFWDTAREVTSVVHNARGRPAVDASINDLQKVWSSGLSYDEIWEALVVANSFELMVTNLGRLSHDSSGNRSGPVEITELWGPVLLNQQYEQQMVGVATWNGQLRLITATRNETYLLDFMKSTLLEGPCQ